MGSEESGDEMGDRKIQLKKLICISDQLKTFTSVIKEQIGKRAATLDRMADDKGRAEAGIKCVANALIEGILTKEADLLETLWMAYDENRVEIEQQIQDRQDILAETEDSLGLVDRLLSPGSEYATSEYLPQIQSQHDDTADFLVRSAQFEIQSSVAFSFTPNLSIEHTLTNTALGVLVIGEHTHNPMQSTTMATSGSSPRSQSCEQIQDVSIVQDPLTVQSQTNYRSPSPLWIDALSSESVSSPSPADRVTLQKVLGTRLYEDENTPYICDMLILDDNTDTPVIVVVDSDNECVKSFYEERGQQKSYRLKLDNSPLCIAKLSHDRVVVGVLSYKLCIISVSPDLGIVSTVNTENVYSSLAILKTQEKIFNLLTISHTTMITARDSVIERFMFKDNKLKNPFTLNSPGDFSRITSLCATPSGDIVVCDANVRAVVCLKLCGTSRWRYQQNTELDNGSQISAPTSVTCDKQGNIYLVSHGDHQIIKLSSAGDDKQVVATRLTVQSPMAVVTDHSGNLFVSQENGDIKTLSISFN